MMDTESVRSGRSERSQRSQLSGRPQHHSGRHHHRGGSGHGGDPERQRLRSAHRSDRETDQETDRDDRSNRHGPPTRENMNTSVVVNGVEGRGDGNMGPPAGGREDENWGETTTVITGATSDVGYSMEDVRIAKDPVETIGFHCARYIGAVIAGFVAVVAFLSPIAMIVLPKVGINDNNWTDSDCGPACEGLLVGVAFKLLILAIGTWALFLRRPKSTMPRVFVFRAVVVFLTFVLTFAYWLFYGVRILLKPLSSGGEFSSDAVSLETALANVNVVEYEGVVSFAASLVDALLFVHYLAVILIEVRQLQVQYVVKVTRSPDGETHSYNVGQFSVQRLAVWCLEQYYKDFQVYNPYLDNLPRRSSRPTTEYKIYDVDGIMSGGGGGGGGSDAGGGRPHRIVATSSVSGRRRETGGGGHNDRFYEEEAYERRVSRRKARLVVAAEEAFAHIKRMQQESVPDCPMTAEEAAQAIFPTLSRPLQKFLRVTRQQPRYSQDNVLEHLATCVAHDLSHKAFLSQYLTQGPVVWNDKDYSSSETWTLVCDKLLSRSADDSTVFQLRQGDIVLLVVVRKLPHFNLVEEVLDYKSNKFVLRLNSETSV